MTTYEPDREQYAGSDLSGSNGESNRTVTLTGTDIQSDSINIIIDGTALQAGGSRDYTYAAGLVTFIRPVYDAQLIQIDYLYEVSSVSTTSSSNDTKYTTLLAFNQFLQWDLSNMDRAGNTATPSRENVGTGDGATTVFWFDYGYVIRNSETLYTGGSTEATATTELTYTTDYTIDWDLGKITLTASGVGKVGTDNIYAEYSRNKHNIKDTLLYNALLRAEDYIDRMTNTVFYDGTLSTPQVGSISNELHEGQGAYNRVYQTDKYPIDNTTTTLNGAVSTGDSTITVSSTNGFPSSGTFAVNTDKVTYTGKTTTTFTGCTGVSNDHDDGETVTSYVIERALDDEGNEPSFTVLEPDTGYSIDWESGEIKLVSSSVVGTTILDNFNPPTAVWDRIRVSYNYGYDEIYDDVIKCVHMIAAKEVFSGQVLGAIARGTDGFNTASIDNIDQDINKIINKYKCWLIKDTKP